MMPRHNLPIHPMISRCLAHPDGSDGKKPPKDWCERRYQCARHQTIAHDRPERASCVVRRVCNNHDFGAFIPLDDPDQTHPTDSEGGEA